MGDTGALVIGMFLATLTIHFIELNHELYASNPYKFTAPIGAAAAFIIIPLADTLRIVILRLVKGKSPFAPDKSHIHHALMRLGLTHAKTTLILAAIQLAFIAACILFNGYSDFQVLVTIVLVSAILSITLDRMIIGKL